MGANSNIANRNAPMVVSSQAKHSYEMHTDLQSRATNAERQAVTAIQKRRNRKLDNVAYYTHNQSNKDFSNYRSEAPKSRYPKEINIAVERTDSQA